MAYLSTKNKQKTCLIIIFSLLTSYFSILHAQSSSVFFKKLQKTDSLRWINTNKANIDISEVSFINWSSGGSNSIAGRLGLNSEIIYRNKNKDLVWISNLRVRYGVNKQEKQDIRKTDDVLEINSNLGYRTKPLSNWFYSAKLSFKTQFTNGYKYAKVNQIISKLMAPGYLFFGTGVEFGENIEKFSLYLSPLTLKTTFVLDNDLANKGAFGVTPAVKDEEGNIIKNGEHANVEFGVLLTNSYEADVFENVKMKHLLRLYTDYLNSFGNIDVDWQVNFKFKVNDYIRATLESNLVYDNDINSQKLIDEKEKIYETRGPKAQWKQLLGIGVTFGF
ncbi:DUF3078 domain-containing protein [Tenacibaculum sp. UWU-22]|uniref:DUF3078 domain-containing protein n=1 Tax=Tenacibaculum sp. UWU-22 TaxID=3234187 RepID=UPI0034DB6158